MREALDEERELLPPKLESARVGPCVILPSALGRGRTDSEAPGICCSADKIGSGIFCVQVRLVEVYAATRSSASVSFIPRAVFLCLLGASWVRLGEDPTE